MVLLFENAHTQIHYTISSAYALKSSFICHANAQSLEDLYMLYNFINPIIICHLHALTKSPSGYVY